MAVYFPQCCPQAMDGDHQNCCLIAFCWHSPFSGVYEEAERHIAVLDWPRKSSWCQLPKSKLGRLTAKCWAIKRSGLSGSMLCCCSTGGATGGWKRGGGGGWGCNHCVDTVSHIVFVCLCSTTQRRPCKEQWLTKKLQLHSTDLHLSEITTLCPLLFLYVIM